MASTSTTADQPDRESINTSQGTAPFPSTSVISSSPSLCSSCFDWVSFLIPWFPVQSNPMPSAASAGLKQDNEVNTGTSYVNAPSASSSAVQSNSMASTSTVGLKQENGVNRGAFHGNAPSGSAVQSNSMASTSTASFEQESEVYRGAFHGMASSAPTPAFQSNSMASTSTASLEQESEVYRGALHGMASSAPTPAFQSNSMASTSTARLEQESEVYRGAFHGMASSAPTPAFQSNSMASTSTASLEQESEVYRGALHGMASFAPNPAFQSNSMASTSTARLQQESEVYRGTFHRMASSAPTPAFQSNSMASTSTASLEQESEVYRGAFHGMASSAPTPAFQSNSMASTSTASLEQESKVYRGALHGMASSAPTPAFQSNSMASTSTARVEQESEVHRGAFRGIAPPAPTSATIHIDMPSYDVFLNHRGPDVKNKFGDDLYTILTRREVRVFLDKKKSKYGDFLPGIIEAAMASALVHIAIFSERYAESPWCLAELSFMLKSGAPIIPIFYHVNPDDLRHIEKGKGKYVNAFKKHEKKGRISSEQLKDWKKALHVVSFYYGEIIVNDASEKLLKENIVNKVSIAMHNMRLVGLEEIVKDFEMNTPQSVEGVQIVVIQGIGGSGKTTLAKELYIKKRSSCKSSFVCDVREAATKGLLHMKQLKILQDLGVHSAVFDNIKVLIVLDDVDKVEDLKALLPEKDRLGSGSLIIVTTRTSGDLESWGISSTYEMKLLDDFHARQLFCYHAFLKECPPDGFNELVTEFVDKCKGLPLALKAFGRQLRGEFCRESWKSLLGMISSEEIEKTPKLSYNEIDNEDKGIKEMLKVKYDTLDNHEKEMFLDTACFFIEEERSLAIEVWNGLGLNGLRGLETLRNKFLVELDDYNYITMHDHFKNLGREIANRRAPYRLWSSQQTINVQNQEEESIDIRGIMAISTLRHWDYRVRLPSSSGGETPLAILGSSGEVNDFGCCSPGELVVNTNSGRRSLKRSLDGLKFFVISGDYFNNVMGAALTEVVWLRWVQIEQRNLPRLSLTNLRVLELYEDYNRKHDLEGLWGETDSEAPVQLRELRISECHIFKGFPNSIGNLNYLKKIVIIRAYVIKGLPAKFCHLQSLEHLVLYNCSNLSILPEDFGKLKNLQHLCLCGCVGLTKLPLSFRNLIHLKYLDLKRCYVLSPDYEDLIPKNIDTIHRVNSPVHSNFTTHPQ